MSKIHWFNRLFWLVGVMYLNFLTLKFKKGVQSLKWVKYHLCYEDKYVPFIPYKVKSYFVFLLGLDLTILLIFGLSKLAQVLIG